MEFFGFREDRRINIEYEWRPQFCNKCKRVDHLESNCPDKVKKPEMKSEITEQWVVKKRGKLVPVDTSVEATVEGLVDETNPLNEWVTFSAEVAGVRSHNSFAALEVIADEEQGGGKVDVQFSMDVSSTAEVDKDGFIMSISGKKKAKQKKQQQLVQSDRIARTKAEERRRLWQGIVCQYQLVNGPWLAIGDWNAVRAHGEKLGGLRVPQAILNEFNEVLHSCAASISGHYGMMVYSSVHCSNGPQPFRFLKFWCLMDEVEGIVARFWNSSVQGNPVHQVMKKLRLLKEELKIRNKTKGNVTDKERKARKELEVPLRYEEVLWGQISRIQWFQENNRCTRSKVSEAERGFLEAPMTEDEVKQVVMNFKPDKSQGPDGFPYRFFQSYWHILKAAFIKGRKVQGNIILASDIHKGFSSKAFCDAVS
ncbi:uncharacterized protein LOC132281678 [Cornus florida]|uniref:uncharacterized protein LOC132281678 n=1 Tax=Cornus florida TaxID=4283 RepID=UPI00289C6355|nr:uncharacterized protein LOC132281678 [Cornus florida]